MMTHHSIPVSMAACSFEEIAIGKAVYFVVPMPHIAWEWSLRGGRVYSELVRWPARIEQLIHNDPSGHLLLSVVSDAGIFFASAQYSEERVPHTWHLAENPPCPPTLYSYFKVATAEDLEKPRELAVSRLKEIRGINVHQP